MANLIIEDSKLKGIASAHIGAASFDEAKKALEKAGYNIITAEENAVLRIRHGKDACFSQNGNYVREGVLYVPKKGRFITRDSLVIAYPKEATNSHSRGGEFYVTNDQAKSVLGNSVSIPYNKGAIPTDRFNEDEITKFVFGETAKDYGLFLKDAGIKQIGLHFNCEEIVNLYEKPYADQLWMWGLHFNSDLEDSEETYGLSLSTVRGIHKRVKNAAKTLDAKFI